MQSLNQYVEKNHHLNNKKNKMNTKLLPRHSEKLTTQSLIKNDAYILKIMYNFIISHFYHTKDNHNIINQKKKNEIC